MILNQKLCRHVACCVFVNNLGTEFGQSMLSLPAKVCIDILKIWVKVMMESVYYHRSFQWGFNSTFIQSRNLQEIGRKGETWYYINVLLTRVLCKLGFESSFPVFQFGTHIGQCMHVLCLSLCFPLELSQILKSFFRFINGKVKLFSSLFSVEIHEVYS